MKKINKNYFLWSLPLSLVSTIPISCQTQAQSIKENETKLEKIINEKDNLSDWDAFLKYDYVNRLLKLQFNKDKNNENRNKFIKDQKKLNNKEENYLSKIKKYLFYASNPTRSHTKEGQGTFLNKIFGPKLDELLTNNWLWFLFNLNRFTFANYEVFNAFKADFKHLNEDVKKNALKLGPLNKPKTNEIIDFSIFKHSDNKKINVFLITKEGIIFRIDFEEDSENTNKKKVSIFGYTYIYPDLYNNEQKIRREFNLKEYVEVIMRYNGDVGRNTSNSSSQKILFDEKFGGEPLRYTIIDIDIDN